MTKNTILNFMFLLLFQSSFSSANSDVRSYSVDISSDMLVPLLLEFDSKSGISASKLTQIRETEVLLPVSANDDISEPDKSSIVTMNQGGNVKIVSLGRSGVSLLPVFSSWAELKAFFPEPISAVVMPMENAATMFLEGENDEYNYMVVNMASSSIHINVRNLRLLERQR